MNGRKAFAISESRPKQEVPEPAKKKDPPKKATPKKTPEKKIEKTKASSNKSVAITDLMEMNSKVITELPGIKLDLPEIELAEDEEVAKEFEHMFIQFEGRREWDVDGPERKIQTR